MINQNELRVGCWVDNLQGLPIKCTWENIKWNQDINPIELTPEILERCGLVYEDLGDESPYEWWYDKEYNEFRIWDFNQEHWIFDLSDQNGFPTQPFKYLHQLQNIYYFLLNKELKYTP